MLLVTGGAGYIGSHFVQAYLQRHPQQSVLVIDNLSEGHAEALASFDRVTHLRANVGDVATVAAAMKQYDITAVVHFAASCYVGESQQEPTKYFQNNVVQTLGLLQAMEQADVKRIVFSSTCASYGHPQYTPIDEAHPQKPINVYGLTKYIIEQALQGYHNTTGLSYIALRYFNAAGADLSGLLGEHHEPETHLIPLVLQTALGHRDAIAIYGEDYDTPDGTCVRDYIHVSDLADAHCKALERLTVEQSVAEVFNLGTEHGASVKQVIRMAEAVTGRKINVTVGPRRPGDPGYLVAKADKAKTILGWQPAHDLQSILASAWQWEQNRRY